ncbi:MAG: GNAT family N-acetyltransferase [Simkaniaceae bacterium]|nr:GNAT family N-acetyltransferase [Simkaniaceae bacterium]
MLKCLIFFTLIFCSNYLIAIEPINRFEILQLYETCYDARSPAIENSEQSYASFSDIPYPLFNIVMHLKCNNVEDKIDALIKKSPDGIPISFWSHSENQAKNLVDILEKKGFSIFTKYRLMAWSVKSMQLEKYDIRPARTNLEKFYEITETVFHFNSIIKEKYAKLIKNFKSDNYLIYSENIPIGTGILYSNGKIGAIFNIGILPEYQQMGYGRAMMEFLMHEAHKNALEKLVLVCSSSVEQFYLDLGFEKILDINVYALPINN